MPMPLLTSTAFEPSTPGAVSERTDYDPTRLPLDPVVVASADPHPASSSHDIPPTKYSYSYSLPVSTLTSASSTPSRKRSPSVVHRRNQSQGHITFPAFPLPTQQFPAQNPTSHMPAPPPSNAKPAPRSMPIPPALGPDQQQTKTTATPAVERESYTLSDRTSTFAQTTGEIPPPLIGSTATIHKDRMFVFGGKRQGGGPSNELYVLDLETLVWTCVLESTELLGTTSRPLVSAAGRLHPLSPRSHQPMQTNTTTVRGIGPGNPKPRARYDHSAVLVVAPPLVHVDGSLQGWASENEAHLVIHGGRTVDNSGAEISLCDTHILDLQTLRWIPTSFARSAETVDGTQPLTTQGLLAALEQLQQLQPTLRSTSITAASEEPNPLVSPSMTTTLELKPTVGLRTLDSALPHAIEDSPNMLVRDDTDHSLPATLPETTEQGINQRQAIPCPMPRFGHLASLSGDQMLVIGGQKPSGEYVLDIDILDLKRQIWISGGKTAGLYSRRLSTLAASEEKPMVRRRRRYLECLAADMAPSALTTPISPAAEHVSSQTIPTPTSALLDPLLNPRKNSWHRGEGHPFDIPNIPTDFRQRFKSDSGVHSELERDDNIWHQKGENAAGGKAHGLVGLGMDPEISKALAQSAGLSMTAEEAMARARKSSVSLPKSPSISGQSNNSGKSRAKSVSNSQKANRRSPSASPVTHAVPAKFFAKSSGGNVFDLDNLATTIAREQPKAPPGKGRGSIAKELVPISSRRSSGSSASSGAPRRVSESSNGPIKSPALATRRNVSEGIPSITSVTQEIVKPIQTPSKSLHLPTPVFPAQYLYANRDTKDFRIKREFIKVQARAGALEQTTYKIHLDARSEWAALDEPSSLLGTSEGLLPPKLESPVGHIVDHYFLLSGASTLEQDSASGSKPAPAIPAAPTVTARRRSFSVWMHHLQNHQWTQLELSKGLGSGEWNHAVIDPDGNYLYVLGQRKTRYPSNQSADESEQGTLDEIKPTKFTHLVKVDLEGFEISPDVDESSVGLQGVNLGLLMLRDGVASDVVIVSSADGGRVRVNSGIVGQRWGHFQALMEERATNQAKTTQNGTGAPDQPASTPLPPLNTTSKGYLEDTLVEVAVPETTPILVGFLQYLYTNELATAHQLKLKTLQGLLLIAHLYDLTRLRQLVRRELYRQLNANNAPLVCQVAVLTHEYGLQTRALRTLLQSARLAQLRRQGEAAEAKRRLDFAVSRLEEIEEDRKRKESMRQSSIQDMTRAANTPGGTSTILMGHTVSARSGSVVSSTSTSGTSTPGLGAIGRFFRGKEESTDLASSPLNPRSAAFNGPAALSAPIYTPEFDIEIGPSAAISAPPPVAAAPIVRTRTVSATSPGVAWEQAKKGHLRSRSFHQPMSHQNEFGASVMDPAQTTISDGPSHLLSSPRLSASQGRNMTAPPPSSTGHLTLAQKIQKRLSIKPREPALDYFRPSHYHPSPEMHTVPLQQRSQPNFPTALPSPPVAGQSGTRLANGLTMSALELGDGGEFSPGSLSNHTNNRYSYSSIDSEGTSNSFYGAQSSAFTGSEEIGKGSYYFSAASTVSSSSLSSQSLAGYENSSSQSLDQMQGHSSSQQPRRSSASSLGGHSSHGSLDRALSKKERKLVESQHRQKESQRRREQKAADRVAAALQITPMNAFAAYR